MADEIIHASIFSIARSEANFDRACDAAWSRYMRTIGMDDDGHATRVEDWERSECRIHVEFRTYACDGEWHHYEFSGAVHKGGGE